MSKFLSAMSDPEEEEEEVTQAEDQSKQDKKGSKNQKKKEKKKKKKAELDDIDEIVGASKQTTETLPPQFQEQQPQPVQPQNAPKEQAVKEQPVKVAKEQPVKGADDDEEEGEDAAEKGETKGKKKKDKKKKATKEEKPEKEKPMNAIAKKALEQKLLKEKEEQRVREEQERLQREEDERIAREEEEERLRKLELEQKAKAKQDKIDQLKADGKYLTKKQKQEQQRLDRLREQHQIQTVQVEDRSNVVRRTKKKPNDGQVQHEGQPQQQQQQQPQPQSVEPPQIETTNTNPEPAAEVDDWETAFQDEQVEQQVQEAAPVAEEQKQSSADVVPQTLAQQQRAEDMRKLDGKMNKELAAMYMQQGEFRSPICCILGHVDTGKTTLLDKIRNTNVQEGEAGGITQQIGATFFPGKKLAEELTKTHAFYPVECKLPGLLIIDTPGHESFSNLRTRGSSLCDLAILVVDLMHGLENQTIESLELLKMRKTPFVIALNKIDRCFEWGKRPMGSSYDQLQKQKKTTKSDYENRKQQIFTQLAERGFNVAHYWQNDDPNTYVSVVPTSGITGEGIPDLLSVIVKYTSVFLKKKVTLKEGFNCTVLELKVIEGHGPTIDCILVDGVLRKDDRIVLQGFSGPIVTKVKAILTPHPMKEMRVKGEYIYHDVLYASMGLKIAALDLEDAVAGSQLYVVNTDDQLQDAKVLLQNDFDAVKQKIQLSPTGVGVVASTLGSLEALLQFLKNSKIPVSYVSVGPVSKDDVMKAVKNVVLEDPKRRQQEYACLLVFDVKVLPEAKEYADVNQIKVFEARIIYHLFDQFTAYVKQIQEERKAQEGKDAVFPCILKTVAFFNKKDPIIMGVDIEKGVLRPGTPVCLFGGDKIKIGVVETIEINHKSVKEARQQHGSVAIRLRTDSNITAGRHFDINDKLASIITRHSIEILKKHFREELSLDDWELVKELKEFLGVI